MQRRTFLSQSAMAAGALMVLPACDNLLKRKTVTHDGPAIGLQLYTVRDEVPNGLEALLKKIADMGYTHIEMYGYEDNRTYFGKTIKELDTIMRDLNLSVPSAHVTSEKFEKGEDDDFWKKACEDAAYLGQEYIVVPGLTQAYKDADGYKRLCDFFNHAGALAKAAGLQFAYHNHDAEFAFNPATKSSLYEAILAGTDPALVHLELDLYWAVRAEADPVTMFMQHPGRFKLWHVKDLDPVTRQNADIGKGSIDFKTIFKYQKDAGMQYFFVEQENYAASPLDSIKAGIEYVKAELVGQS